MEVTKRDLDNLEKNLNAQIEQIPGKILNTTFTYKNGGGGEPKQVRIGDAMVMNSEAIACINRQLKDGTFYTTIKNSKGSESLRKLVDILTDLNTAPSRWFANTASFSSNAVKIFAFLFKLATIIGAIWVVFEYIIKAKTGGAN